MKKTEVFAALETLLELLRPYKIKEKYGSSLHQWAYYTNMWTMLELNPPGQQHGHLAIEINAKGRAYGMELYVCFKQCKGEMVYAEDDLYLTNDGGYATWDYGENTFIKYYSKKESLDAFLNRLKDMIIGQLNGDIGVLRNKVQERTHKYIQDFIKENKNKHGEE